MKLVQINRDDVMGERFNGYAIIDKLQAQGISSTHLVWDRSADDPRVKRFTPFPGVRAFNNYAVRTEERISTHAMLQVQSFGLPLQKDFIEADIVHYHIIHASFFSVAALPLLSALKPSVWTWHDPWPMTGHCIHPKQCTRWQIGCGECPDLTSEFPMLEDKTAENFRRKRDLITRSDVDIVVSSSWMMKRALISPMGKGARLHQIPFGLDLEVYRPMDKAALRVRLGIEPGRVVVALRAQGSIFKGLDTLVDALTRLQTDTPLCILAIQETGHFNHLLGRHQIIETGMVHGNREMAEILGAADLFVMPSTAESFGMMAVEAMACGVAVVVCEGTALPETTHAPDVGVAAPVNDPEALAEAIKRLVEEPDELRARGERARRLTEQEYAIDLHVQRLSNLYRETVARRRGSARKAGS